MSNRRSFRPASRDAKQFAELAKRLGDATVRAILTDAGTITPEHRDSSGIETGRLSAAHENLSQPPRSAASGEIVIETPYGTYSEPDPIPGGERMEQGRHWLFVHIGGDGARWHAKVRRENRTLCGRVTKALAYSESNQVFANTICGTCRHMLRTTRPEQLEYRAHHDTGREGTFGDPTAACVCNPEHIKARHIDGTGACGWDGCGCLVFVKRVEGGIAEKRQARAEERVIIPQVVYEPTTRKVPEPQTYTLYAFGAAGPMVVSTSNDRQEMTDRARAMNNGNNLIWREWMTFSPFTQHGMIMWNGHSQIMSKYTFLLVAV